jgi:hypothetical protein
MAAKEPRDMSDDEWFDWANDLVDGDTTDDSTTTDD